VDSEHGGRGRVPVDVLMQSRLGPNGGSRNRGDCIALLRLMETRDQWGVGVGVDDVMCAVDGMMAELCARVLDGSGHPVPASHLQVLGLALLAATCGDMSSANKPQPSIVGTEDLEAFVMALCFPGDAPDELAQGLSCLLGFEAHRAPAAAMGAYASDAEEDELHVEDIASPQHLAAEHLARSGALLGNAAAALRQEDQALCSRWHDTQTASTTALFGSVGARAAEVWQSFGDGLCPISVACAATHSPRVHRLDTESSVTRVSQDRLARLASRLKEEGQERSHFALPPSSSVSPSPFHVPSPLAEARDTQSPDRLARLAARFRPDGNRMSHSRERGQTSRTKASPLRHSLSQNASPTQSSGHLVGPLAQQGRGRTAPNSSRPRGVRTQAVGTASPHIGNRSLSMADLSGSGLHAAQRVSNYQKVSNGGGRGIEPNASRPPKQIKSKPRAAFRSRPGLFDVS